MRRYVSEPMEGPSEATEGTTRPEGPNSTDRGAGGPSVGSEDGCPCMTCRWATDCGDDFYCPDFEAWFRSVPASRWGTD